MVLPLQKFEPMVLPLQKFEPRGKLGQINNVFGGKGIMLKQNDFSEEQTRCTECRKVFFSCTLTANQPCRPTMEYPKCFNLETRSGGIYHCVNGRLLPNFSTPYLGPIFKAEWSTEELCCSFSAFHLIKELHMKRV